MTVQLTFVAMLGHLLDQAEKEREREGRARQIIHHVNQIHRIIIGYIAGVAGEGLIGGGSKLEQAYSLRAGFDRELPPLQALLADNPKEYAHLLRLQKKAEASAEKLKQVKRMFKHGGDLALAGELPTMKLILRDLISELEAILSEERLIERTSPQIQATQRQRVRELLLTGVILNIIISIVLVFYFNKSFTNRLAIMMDNSIRLGLGQRLNPPLSGNDELSHLDSQFRDMTGALDAAARKERAVVENAADVIFSLDDSANFTKVSPAALKMWGYDPAFLIGKHCLEIVPKVDAKKTMEALNKVKTDDSNNTFESRVVRKHGEIIDIVWSVHWSEPDNLFFCVAHDITERKLAEQVIKEAEARVRQILESLPIGLMMVTLDGKIVLANKTFEEVFGFSLADIEGETIDSILIDNRSQTKKINIDFIVENALGRTHECFAHAKDGADIPVEVSFREIETLDGKRLVGLILDITERHNIEAMKAQFVQMVSHDLRTPLTSVQSYLDLLGRGVYGTLSESGGQKLLMLNRSVDRLVNMIRDLLDLERWQSGHLRVTIGDTNLKSIVEQSVEAVQSHKEEKKIDLIVHDKDMKLRGDEERLVQVVINLLHNAIKFSPEGGKVELSVLEKEGFVNIQVKDEGPGVPAEMQKAVFDRFKQVSETDATVKKGTGLGLAISKAIVEAHGGTIGITSNNGGGSIFWFTLPE